MVSKLQTSVLTVLVIVALVFSFLAYRQRGAGNSTDDTMARIQQTKTIEACVGVWPPAISKDPETGEWSGHLVDAMNLIAEKMEAKVHWNETSWGNAVADLASKRCDVVPALFANVPRAVVVAFTKPPVFYVGESALVRADDSRFQNLKDPFELDKSDITVAVATGESGDIWVKENFKNAKVRRIDVETSDLSRFLLEVSAGRADVGIADASTIRDFASQQSGVRDVFQNNQFGLNPVAFAVRQDDVRWLHFMETALQFLDTQGTLRELEKKYDAHWLHLVKEYRIE